MNQRRIQLARFVTKLRPALLGAVVKSLLRISRTPYHTQEGDFWIDPASDLGLRLIDEGVYEPATTQAIKKSLRPGDTFVDAGANEGYFAVVAATCVGAKGRVIAIEPQRRLFRVLQRNFALNNCPNIVHVASAISDRTTTASLHLTPNVNNSASSLVRPTRYPLFRQTVECRTLESILDDQGVTHCDLMKIDIEGWEYEAVLGSRDLFRKHRVRQLIVEIHESLLAQRGLTANEIMTFLGDCGYRPSPQLANVLLSPETAGAR